MTDNTYQDHWPFPRVDKRRWDACSEDDHTYLQFAMDHALQECEAARDRAAIASALRHVAAPLGNGDVQGRAAQTPEVHHRRPALRLVTSGGAPA